MNTDYPTEVCYNWLHQVLGFMQTLAIPYIFISWYGFLYNNQLNYWVYFMRLN